MRSAVAGVTEEEEAGGAGDVDEVAGDVMVAAVV